MEATFRYLHLLACGLLIGKVALLSFVVAPVLAKTLEPESFGKVVRQLFPAYYVLGMASALLGLAAVTCLSMLKRFTWAGVAAGLLWLIVLAAEAYCRSPLTPTSNEMRDRLKQQERTGSVDLALQRNWQRLHQRSVYLNTLVLFCALGLLGFSISL
ncbi:MAG TPA: DUF4149 domain-containing protein [Nitrospiraceae bacterium]|nr:DUF4149 domain-containing protein [Nitrospiraceae bacterium]